MINGDDVSVTIGSQKRDIISIADILRAIEIVVESGKARGYDEVPVGTGISPTVAEIVSFIWDKTGKKSVVNWGAIPMRENEPDCCADTSKIKTFGEWNPMFWKDGITDMINKMGI